MRQARFVELLVAAAAGALLAATVTVRGGRPPEFARQPEVVAGGSEAESPPEYAHPGRIGERVEIPAPILRQPGVPSEEIPEGTLRVRVLDTLSRPVGRAEVRAFATGEGFRRLAWGSGSGEGVDLLVPPGAPLRVAAFSDPLFEAAALEPITSTDGPVTLVLRPRGARIGGRVIAEETEAPVGGAWITFESGGSRPHVGVASASENGEFDLFVLPGRLRLIANASGREPAERVETMEEGEWRTGLTLVLPAAPKAWILGRVIDDDGAAIPGARVRVSLLLDPRLDSEDDTSRGILGEVAADAQGRFRYESHAGPHRLTATSAGFATVDPTSVVLEAGENEATLVLPRSSRLRIRAWRPDGSICTEGNVTLLRNGREVVSPRLPRAGGWMAETGSFRRPPNLRRPPDKNLAGRPGEWLRPLPPLGPEGFLEIETLAGGSYEVRVQASPELSGRARVLVPSGETASVDVRLSVKK